MSIRLVQYLDSEHFPQVARVEENTLIPLEQLHTTYELVKAAVVNLKKLSQIIDDYTGNRKIDYEQIVSTQRLLPPVMHPDPVRFWITGTGLTHLGSASQRDAMHTAIEGEKGLTDTMKMFKMGLEGGKPPAGQMGVQPEWFYKGNGYGIVAPEAPLLSPGFAEDGGEEPEICGLYYIADDHTPYRIGFALGNEFSDHIMEKRNYLYLAHSKLRPSSFGPELLVGDLPEHIEGTVRIIRNNETFWEAAFLSGEKNMSHSLANLEAHHFKYELFRNPGDLHCHYFGTAMLSFGQGIQTQEGDVFEITAPPFGKPLRNTLKKGSDQPITIKSL